MNQKEVLMLALKEKFDSLPQALQDAITASDYQQKLVTISQKYKLSVEQLGILEQETTMVLLGITLARDYAKELGEQLKLDETTLNNIVTDVNSEVFVKIKDLLIGIEEDTDAERERQAKEDKQNEALADEMSAKLNQEKSGIVPGKPEEGAGAMNLSQVKLSSTFSAGGATNTATKPNLTTPGNNPPPKIDPYREKPE
mgnify:CR=1 FL=1